MPIKILHSADFHLDSPFDSLPPEKAAQRRGEQRSLLERLAQLVDDEGVQLVLLSGDLLDSSASYYETQETLTRVLSHINAKVFIAPGNHDFYCSKSPYSYLNLPDNVHVFTSPIISFVELPELGCRVWGAGFNAPLSKPLLSGFSAGDDDLINVMTLHGDMGGDAYNHITEAEIASSNLDYLALGHTHSFSGIKFTGKTAYAYPGCPEGRGFDETGEKGVIIGTVSRGSADLRFVPLGGREYRILKVDLTGRSNIDEAVSAAIPAGTERDICRVVLSGEYDGAIDLAALAGRFSDRFYSLTFRNETRPRRDIWAFADDDTLKGLFLRRLRESYDSADETEKDTILMAVRCGLAALDGGEEWIS